MYNHVNENIRGHTSRANNFSSITKSADAEIVCRGLPTRRGYLEDRGTQWPQHGLVSLNLCRQKRKWHRVKEIFPTVCLEKLRLYSACITSCKKLISLFFSVFRKHIQPGCDNIHVHCHRGLYLFPFRNRFSSLLFIPPIKISFISNFPRDREHKLDS